MTQKNNKDLITVKITLKGVNLTLDRTLLAILLLFLMRVRQLPLAPPHELSLAMRHGTITSPSDIIDGNTISMSGFKYNETEKRWIARSGLSRWEDFDFERTKPAQNYEGTEGNSEKYDGMNSSIATIKQMQITTDPTFVGLSGH
ncbi:hypothetical protein M9H77_18405 [Catharanthus roseus]|uniref:Uncharacterized protein n=1 Tax=Catharanthus roseus TaxID=4058 RepID=A0ACC0B7C2_CATRO|nr:hypothetical protein M9H77_18405 [Catharanthus roseus]